MAAICARSFSPSTIGTSGCAAQPEPLEAKRRNDTRPDAADVVKRMLRRRNMLEWRVVYFHPPRFGQPR
jgi:hypothetical protein